MPVPAYTDLFNEAIDDLTATLQEITGLQVVNDPRNIVPPCAFIDIFYPCPKSMHKYRY